MEEKKEINIRKKILVSLAILVGIVAYFGNLLFLKYKIDEVLLLKINKILSFAMLFLTIIIFEIAYKKDNGILAIFGIETLFIAISTLIMNTMIIRFNFSYKKYIIIMIAILALYYILKMSIIFAKEKKKYLNSLSDIRDIVK